MQPKVAILGAGANGSCIGADLTEAGADVVLIDPWHLHVETMRQNGLRIRMPEREQFVKPRVMHLGDVATLTQPFDVVLLAMKAYDTRWAVELIKPHLSRDGLVVGLQNAMTAHEIVDVIGGDRTIAAAIELSSEMFTPGYVKRNVPPAKTWIGLGVLDEGAAGRLDAMKTLLAPVARVEIKRDILAAKWTKLIVNAMCLGPPAVVGLTVLDAIEVPGMRDLMVEIGNEAMRAGADLGYGIEPIFGLTREDLDRSNNPASMLFDKLVADIGPGRGRNTVLQDLLKGRASEVGMINGRVVEEARRRGTDAPANARIAELTRRIEAGKLAPSPANIALDLGAG